MIERVIGAAFKEYLNNFRVISLTGPRQSGKTTYLKNELKDYKYVNLENPDSREFATKDPKGFLKEFDSKVIFDEVQRVPTLFSYLQPMVDEANVKGQFILSGSQNFLLSKGISQSLAGRVGILRLLPFQNQEIKELLKEDCWEQLFKGFYPELYQEEMSVWNYYQNYIDTYVKRDVYELLNIHNESLFVTFLKVLASHIGQELNLSTISRQIGISHTAVRSWLSILETSYIVFKLPPYFKNYNKRLIKSPKLYFYDTGLACNLLGFRHPEELKNYANRGSLFENMVISELFKQNAHQKKGQDFYFWKESNQTEIDLLIPEVSGLHIYEIKSSQTLSFDKFAGLKKFEEISTDAINSQTLIHAGDDPIHTRYDVKTVSWKEI